MQNIKPIKRNEFLAPLSREHHQALLLCWKIKTGFSKGIEVQRIKKYCDWFYTTHLMQHFELEEKFVFPILGNRHQHVQDALGQHHQLRELFNDSNNPEISLQKIQIELEKHIRFEERILFNEVQDIATPQQLENIQTIHREEAFCDNEVDVFWK